jgi:hypothetical protein
MYHRGKSGYRRLVILTALGRGDADFGFPASGFCDLQADGYN